MLVVVSRGIDGNGLRGDDFRPTAGGPVAPSTYIDPPSDFLGRESHGAPDLDEGQPVGPLPAPDGARRHTQEPCDIVGRPERFIRHGGSPAADARPRSSRSSTGD